MGGRVWLFPNRTVFYGQYKCYGPGANTTGRVSWSKDLTDEQAQPFLSWDYVDGSSWIGQV
jgi:pectinesterase